MFWVGKSGFAKQRATSLFWVGKSGFAKQRATPVMRWTDMELLESRLWEKLKEVIDPGANLNVVDMGLIRELSVRNDGTVNAVFRPSSPVCPLAFVLAANIRKALEEVDNVSRVHLRVIDFVKADELNRMMEET